MIEPSFPTWLGIPSVQYTWDLFGDFQLSMYLLHLVRDFQLSICLGYLFRGFPTFSIPDSPGSQIIISDLETHPSLTPPSHVIVHTNFWPVTNHSLSVFHRRHVYPLSPPLPWQSRCWWYILEQTEGKASQMNPFLISFVPAP
jgi:hypothetical protein